jgi:PhnB protein
MTAGAPPGPFTYAIAPWLTVHDGARAIRFYRSAFGAVEVYHLDDAGGGVVAQLSVGGAEFWVSGESPGRENVAADASGVT